MILWPLLPSCDDHGDNDNDDHFGPSVWNSLPPHIRKAACNNHYFQVGSENTFLQPVSF